MVNLYTLYWITSFIFKCKLRWCFYNLREVQNCQQDRQGQKVQCHLFHQQGLSHLSVRSGHQHPIKIHCISISASGLKMADEKNVWKIMVYRVQVDLQGVQQNRKVQQGQTHHALPIKRNIMKTLDNILKQSIAKVKCLLLELSW